MNRMSEMLTPNRDKRFLAVFLMALVAVALFVILDVPVLGPYAGFLFYVIAPGILLVVRIFTGLFGPSFDGYVFLTSTFALQGKIVLPRYRLADAAPYREKFSEGDLVYASNGAMIYRMTPQ